MLPCLTNRSLYSFVSSPLSLFHLSRIQTTITTNKYFSKTHFPKQQTTNMDNPITEEDSQTIHIHSKEEEEGKEREITIPFHIIEKGKEHKNKQTPIICLPGALGTAKSDFLPQLSSLSLSRPTISFDPRGYGLSRPPNRSFSLSFYSQDAKDAFQIMKCLGYENERFDVMGWSDGANSAVLLASLFPSSVRKLVLFGGNAYFTPQDTELINNTRDIKNWSARMREPLEKVYGTEVLQQMWSQYCDVVKEFVTEKEGEVCRKECESVECPTLILHGKKDPMVAPEHPHYFLKHISNSRLIEFPEGKHNIHLRYAPQFNQIVSCFLDDQPIPELSKL